MHLKSHFIKGKTGQKDILMILKKKMTQGFIQNWYICIRSRVSVYRAIGPLV